MGKGRMGATLAAVVILAGCGSGGSTEESSTIASVICHRGNAGHRVDVDAQLQHASEQQEWLAVNQALFDVAQSCRCPGSNIGSTCPTSGFQVESLSLANVSPSRPARLRLHLGARSTAADRELTCTFVQGVLTGHRLAESGTNTDIKPPPPRICPT